MKNCIYFISVCTILILLYSCSNEPKTSDTKQNEDSIERKKDLQKDSALANAFKNLKTGGHILTADSLIKTVLSEFPEAYQEFAEVTYESMGSTSIYPKTVSFVVPTTIVEKKFTKEELNSRADKIQKKFEMNGCKGIAKGKPEVFSWSAWKDRNVTRLTYYFGLGC